MEEDLESKLAAILARKKKNDAIDAEIARVKQEQKLAYDRTVQKNLAFWKGAGLNIFKTKINNIFNISSKEGIDFYYSESAKKENGKIISVSLGLKLNNMEMRNSLNVSVDEEGFSNIYCRDLGSIDKEKLSSDIFEEMIESIIIDFLDLSIRDKSKK